MENNLEEKKSSGKTLVIYVIFMQIFMAIIFMLLSLILVDSMAELDAFTIAASAGNIDKEKLGEILVNSIVIVILHLGVPSVSAVMSAKVATMIRKFHYTESAKNDILYANVISLFIGSILFSGFKLSGLAMFFIMFLPVFFVSKNIILDSMIGRNSALDLIPEKEKPVDPLAFYVPVDAEPIRMKNVELDVSSVGNIILSDSDIADIIQKLKLNCTEYFYATIQYNNLNINSIIAFNEQKTCILELSKNESNYSISKAYTIAWPNVEKISYSGKIGTDYSVNIKYDGQEINFVAPKSYDGLANQKDYSQKYATYIDMKNNV